MLPEVDRHRGRIHRPGKEISLPVITREPAHDRELLACLDSLGNYAHPQVVRHRNNCPDNLDILRPGVDARYERAIDFDHVHREPMEISH